MELVLASTNKGKIAELREMLTPLAITVLSPADFPGWPEVEETGKTFAENAALKAEAGCAFCGQCITHCPTGALTARDDTAKAFKALAGDKVTVAGSGEMFTVGDENATVLCGNVPTANAVVYVVDTVLLP